MEQESNIIGTNIRSIRIKNNLSMSELATRAKTSKQTIYKYENGIVTNIPINSLIDVATALRCNVCDLLKVITTDGKKTTNEDLSFSKWLLEQMEYKNLKQADLANLTGIPRSMINEYLKGKYEPKEKNKKLIEDALSKSCIENRFSSNLKKLMLCNNINQTGLANATGISRSNFSLWLNDKRTPRPESIKIIADFFNVEAHEMMTILPGDKYDKKL